jgi:hypothetical protein
VSRKLLLIVAIALVVAAVSGGIAIAAGVGDDDKPLTGASLQKATAAALAHTGGGTVVESEVGDDGAAYDVEVRRPDGKIVEVQLDSSYGVIGQDTDDDGPNDNDGANDD